MCSVSAVSDYYTRTYPDRFGVFPFSPTNVPTPLPSTLPATVTVPVADAETREMMRQVLKLLDKIDKRLGDIECMDAEKAPFLKALDLDPESLGG